MKFPKEKKDYCKKCKKHNMHKVRQFKANTARTLAWGTRHNEAKYKSGYGGKSRFPATVKKQGKKPTFLLECTVCGAKHYFVVPKRVKKVEITKT